MHKILNLKIKNIIASFFIILLIGGCSKEATVEEKLFGSWTFQKKNVYTVLLFHANKNFTSDRRISNKYSQVVEKTDKVTGQWRVEEGGLYLTANQTIPDGTWEKGVEKQFEILKIDSDSLHLKTPSEKIIKWYRIKGAKKKDNTIESLETLIGVGPIVVNLTKDKARNKDRYLCIDMELILDPLDSENQVLKLHPRIREVAIFYLSSLTYRQVNKMDKISSVRDNLLNILNPYMNGQIKEINVKHIIVTSRKEIVDDFLKNSLEQEVKS